MREARGLRLIEAELRGLHAHVRRQPARLDLVEEPEIVVTHRVGVGERRQRFTELGVDESAPVLRDRRAGVERILGPFAGHERTGRALDDPAAQGEVIEPPALRGGEQDRTTE
jgi:hypothetical protein